MMWPIFGLEENLRFVEELAKTSANLLVAGALLFPPVILPYQPRPTLPPMKSGTIWGRAIPTRKTLQFWTVGGTIMVGGSGLPQGGSRQLTFCQFSRNEIRDYLAAYKFINFPQVCLDTQPVTLQPPSGLSTTAASASSINLAWDDNSTDETGFVVQRRRQGSGVWVQLGTTAAGTVTFSNDGLFSESTYIYRVQAFNDSESSAYSNEAAATTPAGTGVVTKRKIHVIAGIKGVGDGGPAVQALLDTPRGVAVDSSGNLYIADTTHSRIRKVDTSGTITTVAGTGGARLRRRWRRGYPGCAGWPQRRGDGQLGQPLHGRWPEPPHPADRYYGNHHYHRRKRTARLQW